MRILVASYLFMTGFGHFIFFYKKADFSLVRVVRVLIRLNLFTVILCYVMNSSYQAYYFSPLVSVWFGIIWCIMAFYSSKNKETWFLMTKIVAATVICGVLIAVPTVFDFITEVVTKIVGFEWNEFEWRFRFGLDRYIVLIGMLIGFLSLQGKDKINGLSEQHFVWMMRGGWIVSTLALITYLFYEVSTHKVRARYSFDIYTFDRFNSY